MPAKTEEISKWPLSSLVMECKPEKSKVLKWSQIFNVYTHLVFQYPLLILIFSLLLCTIVPVFVLAFYPVQLDNNPEKVGLFCGNLRWLEVYDL